MKFDFITTIIVAALGLLLAWAVSLICRTSELQTQMFITLSVVMCLGAAGLGIRKPEEPRTMVNVRVAIVTALSLLFAYNLILSFFSFGIPALVIPNVIVILIFSLIVIKVLRADVG